MPNPSAEIMPTTRDRFEELCMSLHLDDATNAKETAWESYERICLNYTLVDLTEGDDIQWLACALYVACTRSDVPTVSNDIVEGNCVSLTQLLRSAKLSVIQFFNKMKKWSDMANLPQQFRDKVDRLERIFDDSTAIFKKYQPIFYRLFKEGDNTPRPPRSRKHRRLPCTSQDVFSFCWTIFVLVKVTDYNRLTKKSSYQPIASKVSLTPHVNKHLLCALIGLLIYHTPEWAGRIVQCDSFICRFRDIIDDRVSSYHLLLCSLDLMFANAVLANRRDLLNPEFQSLPEGYSSSDYRVPSEAPCIIDKLCEVHDGLVVEAKNIKECCWKPHIQKLIEDGVLEGNLSNILDTINFESNNKSICNKYEEYVLTIGDFDERIFLDKDADEEIGTPSKSAWKPTSQKDQTKELCPPTPLTNSCYLKDKDPEITPVSTATKAVSTLQALTTGARLMLERIFEDCSENPAEGIANRVKEMGEIFCQKYTQALDEGNSGSPQDFAKRRLKLAENLYYKVLENIMLEEKRRLKNRTDNQHLLEHELFHRSLFACCLEVVIFAYKSQRTFPWILEAFEIPAFHFYKVIELILRAEEGLSRDIVKHLIFIEEAILQDYAWCSNSPLWDLLQKSNQGVPTCEDATIPGQTDGGVAGGGGGGGGKGATTGQATPTNPSQGQTLLSPIIHKRVVQLGGRRVGLLQSPTCAHDRFSSPSPSSAKRCIFPADAPTTSSSTNTSFSPTETIIKVTPSSSASRAMTFTDVQPTTGTTSSPAATTSTSSPSNSTVVVHGIQEEARAAEGEAGLIGTADILGSRTGSIRIFFRKVYHLMNERLLDLCRRLKLSDDLRRKIWTCLEHAVVHKTEMMRDRHLDQIIMCTMYIICWATGNHCPLSEIIDNYRFQPQASSHVYRSVLIQSNRKKDANGNGSVTSSRGSPEPKTIETPILMGSASTLPVPQPSSAPPTPTETALTFDGEQRGDLVKFYYSVFSSKMSDFALRFENSPNGVMDMLETPPLSPLPVPRSYVPRKVSNTHQLYVWPHTPLSLRSGRTYVIQKSPPEVKMNNMVKNTGKRTKQQPLGESSKRPRLGNNYLQTRIQMVQSDRESASSADSSEV